MDDDHDIWDLGKKHLDPILVNKSPITVLHDMVPYQTRNSTANINDTDDVNINRDAEG